MFVGNILYMKNSCSKMPGLINTNSSEGKGKSSPVRQDPGRVGWKLQGEPGPVKTALSHQGESSYRDTPWAWDSSEKALF